MIHNISILGSTGSIGRQALEVARNLKLNVVALSANSNIELLEEQIREFSPRLVAVSDKKAADELRVNIKDLNTKVLAGNEGICEVAACDEAELVLNSIMGIAGLEPTLSAIKAKKNVALANKETLVAGGEIVTNLAKKFGVKIIPVDSEHSAIFQCLQGCNDKKQLKRLILTASGGPFFGRSLDELKNVSLEQTLSHPNWNMGAKITVDSAPMMNKGLEIIEAAWLFDMDIDNISVVIHKESVIHSLIEYVDNSVIAQLGVPDMKIPIQYAITYPKRVKSCAKPLSLTDYGSLSFFEPDYDTFECLKICVNAFKIGKSLPTAINSANEEAVKLFLNREISFLQIQELVKLVYQNHKIVDIKSVEDIKVIDKSAREFVNECVNKRLV